MHKKAFKAVVEEVIKNHQILIENLVDDKKVHDETREPKDIQTGNSKFKSELSREASKQSLKNEKV